MAELLQSLRKGGERDEKAEGRGPLLQCLSMVQEHLHLLLHASPCTCVSLIYAPYRTQQYSTTSTWIVLMTC